MPAGRPSKYDPNFCEELIIAAKQGFSLTGFAGIIGVSRSTIQQWEVDYPEFSVAVSIAKSVLAHSWEKRGINIADGNGGPGAAGMVQFALRNLASDDWKEKQEIDMKAEVSLVGALDDLAAKVYGKAKD